MNFVILRRFKAFEPKKCHQKRQYKSVLTIFFSEIISPLSEKEYPPYSFTEKQGIPHPPFNKARTFLTARHPLFRPKWLKRAC
jgi:hypothetical protein